MPISPINSSPKSKSPKHRSSAHYSHLFSQSHRRRVFHMPVIDQLRNFIRHGKNANNNNNNSQSERQKRWSLSSGSRSSPSTSRSSSPKNDGKASAATAMNIDNPEDRERDRIRETVERIVREEKAAGLVLPKYVGLERYELIEKMGDGAFSNVYKAVDIKTGRKVAIKVVRKYELDAAQKNGQKHMHPEMKKRPRATERANILKEVQIMRGMNHPNVVQLLEFQESKEYYYLILELVEGGELFHRIVRLTYFSEDLARHIIVQVAEGLRYLHEERGVVHRDIKPENLLFEPIPFAPHDPASPLPNQQPGDEEKEDEGKFIPGVGGGGVGRVKIADFGLSKVLWDASTATPCGTVGYTAPEIVRDQKYSRGVDMWALGCVLYTLLCGFPPFYDESIQRLTEKVAKGEYTFLSPWWDSISAGAKDCVAGLLRVDPDERFSITEFFQHPWIMKGYPHTTNNTSLAVPGTTQPRNPVTVTPVTDNEVNATPRREKIFTPGAFALREAFDVTNAVHRVAEEALGRRRRKEAGDLGLAMMELNDNDVVEEEDEKDIEGESHEPSAQNNNTHHVDTTVPNENIPPKANVQHVQQAQPVVYPYVQPIPAKASQIKKKNRGAGFELNMDNATLLGRRKRVGIAV